MGRTFELQVKATREPTVRAPVTDLPESLNLTHGSHTPPYYVQKLVDLDIRVAVSGFLAKTTVTMVFKNETAVETEGEVRCPLKHGICFK
jgi:hypothetical protein